MKWIPLENKKICFKHGIYLKIGKQIKEKKVFFFFALNAKMLFLIITECRSHKSSIDILVNRRFLNLHFDILTI